MFENCLVRDSPQRATGGEDSLVSLLKLNPPPSHSFSLSFVSFLSFGLIRILGSLSYFGYDLPLTAFVFLRMFSVHY